MQDKNEVVLMGYSGHGYVIAEAAVRARLGLVKYYADKNEVSNNPFELIYLGNDRSDDFRGWDRGLCFILGVGDNATREKIALHILKMNETILTVIHPQSYISNNVSIGKGVFIAPNVSLNPLASIGNFSILNTACVIEHECTLGTSVHIAPGAVLAGNVTVGNRSFIGANSVIKQGVTIGEDVIIGAGSVVISDISDGGKFVGNPVKQIK